MIRRKAAARQLGVSTYFDFCRRVLLASTIEEIATSWSLCAEESCCVLAYLFKFANACYPEKYLALSGDSIRERAPARPLAVQCPLNDPALLRVGNTMATSAIGRADRYFYFGMSLVIAGVVALGFSRTVGARLIHPS